MISHATYLHKAALAGNASEIRRLIVAGANPNHPDKEGRTALHLASTGQVAEALIEGGGNVMARDDRGLTPLHEAARSDLPDVAQVLLNMGADANYADPRSRLTPLHLASKTGLLDVTKVLVNAGAQIEARDCMGNTPLLSAAMLDPVGDRGEFLVSCQANPFVTNNAGETPLHLAAATGKLGLCRALVGAGAEMNMDGPTPLHLAAAEGHLEVCKTLIDLGADADLLDHPKGLTAAEYLEDVDRAELESFLGAKRATDQAERLQGATIHIPERDAARTCLGSMNGHRAVAKRARRL